MAKDKVIKIIYELVILSLVLNDNIPVLLLKNLSEDLLINGMIDLPIIQAVRYC